MPLKDKVGTNGNEGSMTSIRSSLHVGANQQSKRLLVDGLHRVLNLR
jgi:hypothetical protein